MSKSLLVGFLVLLVVPCSSLVAQVDFNPPVAPATLPILQGPPGARALGIGGAFIGVSDDATAAESNPAGLTILSRPEISLHLRSQRFALLENCAPTDACETDTSTYPAFASLVYPWRNAVFSVFYSSTLDLSTQNTIRFVEFDDDITNFVISGDASIRRLGVAAAFRPTPMLSIGGSVGVTKLELRSQTNAVFDIGRFIEIDPILEPALFEFNDVADGDDSKLSYNLGVLINPGGRLSVGAVYKYEDDFDLDFNSEERICIQCSLAQLRGMPFETVVTDFIPVSVPDLYGAGIAIRPFARSLIAVDYSVQQSDRFDIDDAGDRISIDQEIQTLRFGAEYLLAIKNILIPLRAGYVREEDPDFETSGFVREDADAYTVGTGLIVGNNQIDLAFSSGRTVTSGTKVRQFVVSGTRRF